ncbi:hypothetical protein MEEL106852_05660 [Megasphaera elsdenii]|uniref:Uncharacterized protein n=1 Tax=Megasphaera elsdenii DSM 20460 TaxID=1064535 RepID=G0VNL4_MEGEL|nr:hypothetical protein MELS_0820 [Megasphaera elsdenii DSM 20460]
MFPINITVSCSITFDTFMFFFVLVIILEALFINNMKLHIINKFVKKHLTNISCS